MQPMALEPLVGLDLHCVLRHLGDVRSLARGRYHQFLIQHRQRKPERASAYIGLRVHSFIHPSITQSFRCVPINQPFNQSFTHSFNQSIDRSLAARPPSCRVTPPRLVPQATHSHALGRLAPDSTTSSTAGGTTRCTVASTCHAVPQCRAAHWHPTPTATARLHRTPMPPTGARHRDSASARHVRSLGQGARYRTSA